MDYTVQDFVVYAVMTVGHATIVTTSNDMFTCILRKDRRWLRYLLVLPCTLIFMALVDTYASGRWGFSITFWGLDFTFPEGAFFYYLGLQFVIQLVCVAFGFISYLWSVIRRKRKFSFAWVGLELLIFAIYATCFVLVVQYDTPLPVSKDMDPFYAVFAAVLFIAIWLGLHKPKNAASKRPTPESAKEPPANREPAAGKSVPDDAEARYLQVLDEQKRLKNEGNYADQIPLLTEATGLPVDGSMKAAIWHLLGFAYEKTDSKERAVECYETALRFQADNPWILNNIALLKSALSEHEDARKNMKAAVDELLKRGEDPGMFYANYAFITGKAGYAEEAEEYLTKAAEAGYSGAKIANIRAMLKAH